MGMTGRLCYSLAVMPANNTSETTWRCLVTGRNKREHYTGCLLGGAVGDALGWPVEFLDREDIVKEYGPDGIMDMVAG